ncbi:MAG: choice-of-anchor Q domain-containing protein, partial [Planctomycetia bacterium]|nr:choice-of-anchor Q domain-containing protein [Planctomycetia bacterium]
MRLFNRFNGDSHDNENNRERKIFRGRLSEGNRRENALRKNLTARKLGLENLEERQLLSVNPIGTSQYNEIRDTYADLQLPASMNDVNIIEVANLTGAALQDAVNAATQTPQDDLIVLRTTEDSFVLDLESTAVTVNLDSSEYGAVKIVGYGDKALTIEAVETNAFTVLNGSLAVDNAVIFNYTAADTVEEMFINSSDADVTLGSSLVIVNQITSVDSDGVATTSYLVDKAETTDVSNAMTVTPYRTRMNPHVDGQDDYNAVRNSVHAVMRSTYDYFGYTPALYAVSNTSRVFDASSHGRAGWVGTVANMLAYTGWAEAAGFSTTMTLPDGTVRTYDCIEDSVVDYLLQNFVSTGNDFTSAQVLDYLFKGDDENMFGANGSGTSNTIEGGGFFQDIEFGKVGGYVAASDSMLQDMLRALRDGNAVTLEINTNGTREYVSVWGYYYNSSTLTSYGMVTNGAATTVGLLCSNPATDSVQQLVTDSRYNNTENNARTLAHYIDAGEESYGANRHYSRYLLSGSGANLTLVRAPYTYLNNQGVVQGAINFPENFNFYGTFANTANTTYTSRIVGFSWLQQYNERIADVAINESSVFALESMPGNTENVVYLYFDGVDGTGWDGLEHPAFSLDNVAGHSVSELRAIEEIWRRVAEDYAPFNINVTTSASVWASAAKGIRCVIGGYSSSAGGLSYVGVFGASKQDNYVYPYSLSLGSKNIAEAASHEVGHSLGLSHDGYEHNEYSSGTYNGTATWGPIMGAPYGAAITQWGKGEYVGATNTQDDIAIIASVVGFREDNVGDTIETASALDDYYVPIDINTYDPKAGTYYVNEYIIDRNDYDVYSFTSHGGSYVVDVTGVGADSRFIDTDFRWNTRTHSSIENAVFGGLYYARSYNMTNLNLKVELLDETGEVVLLDMNGDVMKLSFGESIVLRETDYYFYVVDQFGRKVYTDGNLKEGYQAVDDTIDTTFSHFVTPELEDGKTYYIRVTGVGEGNPTTTGYSDYGSLGEYYMSVHESYENFYLNELEMDVRDISYNTDVDNVLNWQEAFVYSGRRLEDGSTYLGNTLTFNQSLSGQTISLQDTLLFTYSRGITGQPYQPKRFVLDAMNAWDVENDQPGITIDAQQKFRAIYVDNTTVELYGFTITGGVAETTNVIYLYFGGIEGTGWSGELHPAYDIDGDPTTFSDQELANIYEIYQRVAEDYAPYNVTVTTDQSVFEAATNAIRVVVGGTGNNRGGVAYVGSFGPAKQDCYVFPNSLGSAKSIAEAISHEVGHTMGLNHDGQNAVEYYGGANGWAPIMGVGYYQPLSQWSKGEYNGATNTQDDLAIIAGKLAFKDDDYSNTINDAQALTGSYLHSGNLVADGLIERTGDVDFFSFIATDAVYVVDVVGTGANFSNVNAQGYAASLGYSNLDLLVKLYDSDGNLLYTCDPSDSIFAHFQYDGLEVGETYYISVEGTGLGDPTTNGYSNYGSIGQYYVTVAATNLSGFVGEERYASYAAKLAVSNGAINATPEKGETYGQVGQTNNGGGIYNHYGWLTIGNSVIAGNRALQAGGGIYNQGGEYTDVSQHDGWLYLVNTSIIGNIVTGENAIGGGLYNENGGVAYLANVTIAGNTADYSGGGMQNAGRAMLYNTIIASNHATYGADVYTQVNNSTTAYSSIIGDESRNSNLLAQRGGVNTSNGDGNSLIGTSNGTSVWSTVTKIDPEFVGYRAYASEEWSSELWKNWNFRLKGSSPAVDLGTTYLASDLDFGSNYVSARSYANLGMTRFYTDFANDLAGQTRIQDDVVDAGAFELLGKPELTGFVPTSAGSDVVNNWASSIVVSRAIDDQTGSVAPFLVDEPLYLNLSFINEGKPITENFETTVYLWKYQAYSKKAEMYEASTEETGLPIMKISVDFGGSAAMPGAGNATITCTNLATGEVQTFEYDGVESYILLQNVNLGSIADLANGLIDAGVLPQQDEEGYYLFGYKIDSNEAIDELREDNNFFKTTNYFDVVESPVSINGSIVVTTTADVVDPYDGLISLREAVEVYAGSFYYSEVALQEGDVFESNGVTYVVKDGKFYVDTTTNYQVYPGEQFTFETEVDESATWDETTGKYLDEEGNEVTIPAGVTITRDGVEYTYNGVDWNDADLNSYALVDGEKIEWTRTAVVTITYATNTYFNEDGQQTAVSNGATGVFNGVDVELIDGVWTHTEITANLTRDDVQALGVFMLADGTEVAVVNGVFRRVATNDVAIVQDGAVVTLADGRTAVYDYARDRFVVTEITTYEINDGDTIVVDGQTLTYATDAYVDLGGYRYYITEGAEVTLSNGYQVVYENGSFVYKNQEVVSKKLAAGVTVTWNGEEYTYKAGLSLMKRVSRESNAVVFSSSDPNLDGQTFVLEQGPLTLDKTFTLDCIDPDGNLLDLTITSSNDDPCLFRVTEDADATVRNFKFVNASSTASGSIFENYGQLTLEQVRFSNNVMEKGNLIYNASGAVLYVTNSTFENNVADAGALIYNCGDAVVQGLEDELEGTTVYTTFTGDKANLSPVYNQGGTVQTLNVKFDSTSGQRGGAILSNGGAVTVNATEFTTTSATGAGGAIYADVGTTLMVAGSIFTGTTAATDGGAIYGAIGSNVIVTGSTFVENTAANGGGAIYVAGHLNLVNATFLRNTAVAQTEDDLGQGGAIYVSGSMTLTDATFTDNVASDKGGAIYVADTATVAFLTESGVVASFAGNSANEAGAIYSQVGLLFNGDLVLLDNTATGSYGAVYTDLDFTVTGDATISRNAAGESVGAVYAKGGFTVNGLATITENTASQDNSAVLADGKIVVGALELSKNEAGNESGALVAGSSVTVNGDAKVDDNVNGAIVAGTNVTITGAATLENNQAATGSAIKAGGSVAFSGDVNAAGNQALAGDGGVISAGSVTVSGKLVAADNSASGKGGVIYATGNVTLANADLQKNSAVDGGAVYANGKIVITNGFLIENTASGSGAAVYAAGDLEVLNTLFAGNTAGELGGAIYATANTSLVNVTIADNKAADGAGFYNAGTANVDNSILAHNTATNDGYDLYTASGATTTLRNSLLANIAQIGEVKYALVQEYRSILGVDPEFENDYSLKATSPAINAGSNDLDRNVATDLLGNARRVGLVIAGVTRSVDMGAFEYAEAIAPDLAILADSVDYWGVAVLVDGEEDPVELDYFIAGQDVCINFNVQNIGDARVIDNFGFNVHLVGVDENNDLIYDLTQSEVLYATEFDNFDWLDVNDWIGINGVQRLVTNLGVLPAGSYTVTVTLDVAGVGRVYEYGEEDGYEGVNNNVYTSTFSVRELPSVIVTTEQDVVDATDNETSLREALAVAADYTYVTTFMVNDGDSFVTKDGQTLEVSGGYLSEIVDVVYKDGVAYDLQEGDEFLLNGVKVYYHYQLNGGYFSYANGRVADLSSGSLTYPDGTSATIALQTSQYIHYVSGEELNDQEGSRYTYNVLRLADGDVILEDGMEFDVSNVKFTYVQNAQYPTGAFLFDNGDVIEYVDGADLSFVSLAIGTLSTRNARIERAIELEDGSLLQVVDGIAKRYSKMDSTITFAENLQGKTITVDLTQGELVAEDSVVLGRRADNGQEFVIDRVATIDGEDRNVTLSGDNATRILNVENGVTLTINNLTFTKGFASDGGAIENNGTLYLNNVDFVNNNAVWRPAVGDDNLESGLGGAIANYGALTIDGGSFTSNGILPNSSDAASYGSTEFGGAIFSQGDLIVKNATFSGNQAYAGGAIVAQNGALTVENTTFTDNVAERAGAIYTLVPTVLRSVTFTENVAQATSYTSRDVVAGAVYAKDDLTIETAEGVDGPAATFTGNKAEFGGAFFVEGNLTVNGDLVAQNNVAVQNADYATVVNNNYGAGYVQGAMSVNGNLTLEGNTADDVYGALLVEENLTVTGDLLAKNNVAKNGDYGAIAAQDVDVSGSFTATGNSASGAYAALGANLLNVGGDFTLASNVSGVALGAVVLEDKLTVGGNAAITGNVNGGVNAKGGVFVNGDADLQNNTSEQGAAILTDGAVKIDGSLLAKGNSATTGDGGAIYAAQEVTVGGAVNAANNSAKGSGGAIYAKALKVGEGASTLTDNTAGANGGAIYVLNSVVIGGELNASGNTADTTATIVDEQTTTETTTGENGETIVVTTKTTTYAALGGAIYVDEGDAEFDGNATFSKNTAGSGGAVYANGKTVFKGDATFVDNAANAYKVIETTVVTTASDGESTTQTSTTTEGLGDYGALYAKGSLNVAGDLTATGNTATGNYGVTQVNGALVVGGNLDVENNVAQGSYGALDVQAALTVGGNLTAVNNQAVNGSYGAISVARSLVVEGVANISGNKAGENVGALNVVGNLTIKGQVPTLYDEDGNEIPNSVVAATIANNQAGGNYGAIKVVGATNINGALEATGNTAGGAYGAMYLSSSLTVNGAAKLSGNKAQNGNGGVGYVFGAVEVNGDLEMTDNSAVGDYGALQARATVNVNGDATISNNSATGRIGALYAGTGLTITGNATVADNHADGEIGAISTNKDVVVEGNLTLVGNSAGQDVGAISADGQLIVNGEATISKNTAGGSIGAVRATQGLQIDGNAIISENTANGDYGAIRITGPATFGGDATITGNKAGGEVGALGVASEITIAGNAKINGNIAGANYGAIKLVGDLTIGGSAEINNNESGGNVGAISDAGTITVAGDVAILNNKAAGDYGAIRANAFKAGAEDAKVNVTITGNEAGGNYGALYLDSSSLNAMFVYGDVVAENNKASVTATVTEDVTTEVNGDVTTVTTTKTTTLSGKTGAVHLENGSVKITGDATFTGNTAATNGALYAKGGVDVDGNLTFSSNEANGATTVEVTVVTTTTTYDEEGNVTGESVETSTTTTTTYDQGNNGAGSVGGDLNVGGALNVTSNKATNNVGGLNVDGAVKVAGDAILTGNEAGGNVGALTANSVEVGGSATIKDNKAGGDFGGANVQKTFKVTGALTVDANTAGGNVGGVYALGDVTVGADATLTNNSAQGDNGALYTEGKFTVDGALTVDSNTAGGNVGGVYALGDVTVGADATLTNNSAQGDNGALYTEGKFTVDGSATISNNTAGNSYGGVFAKGDVSVGGDLTASSNEAKDGDYGALYTDGALTVTGVATLDGNKASGDYGAAYVGKDVTVGGNLTVTNNEAGGNVGALAANKLVVGAADSEEPVTVIVSGNKAGGDYGAIYLASADNALTVYGDLTAENNKASVTATVTEDVTT